MSVRATHSGRPATVQAWHGWELAEGLVVALLLAGLLLFWANTRAISSMPVEALNIDQITSPVYNQLILDVTNHGSDPVTIAQVQVDDAYWAFNITPRRTIAPQSRATITVPYPSVQHETHVVRLVSSRGATFVGEIPSARLLPKTASLVYILCLGLAFGTVPLALGLLWCLFVHRPSRSVMQVLLSFTAGLSLFLLFNTWGIALQRIVQKLGLFGGVALIGLVALLALLALIALGSLRVRTAQFSIVEWVILGCGLRNLGAGLAVGVAFAADALTLARLLVLGFLFANIVDGIAIAALIAHEHPARWRVVVLFVLASGPALLGVWLGSLVLSQLAVAIYLAVGMGMLAHLVSKIGRLLIRQRADDGSLMITPPALAGTIAGLLLAYMVALLV